MELFSQIIFYAGLYFVLKELYTSWKAHRKLEEKINEIEAKIAAEDALVLRLKCEGHRGVVYCFDEKTDRFICQGNTLDEINETFKARFPDVPGAIVDLDEAARFILQEEINNLTEEDTIPR